MHFPDPDIIFGAFRVLPRTDGKWAVVDERRPPGERTVHVATKKDHASFVARTWHEQGHG
jgi:hypothetical protein